MNESHGLPPIELANVEAQLLKRVTTTRSEYERAKEEAGRLTAISRDVTPANPDGASALARAWSTQQSATRDYARALRLLSEFILDKKVPRDMPRRGTAPR